MTISGAIDIGRQAIYVAGIVCAPILILALIVGLVVSLMQAITQVQEPTVALITKMGVIAGALIFFGPFMLAMLADFMSHSFMLAQHMQR